MDKNDFISKTKAKVKNPVPRPKYIHVFKYFQIKIEIKERKTRDEMLFEIFLLKNNSEPQRILLWFRVEEFPH